MHSRGELIAVGASDGGCVGGAGSPCSEAQLIEGAYITSDLTARTWQVMFQRLPEGQHCEAKLM
jgi:hypothetical protein